MRDGSAAGGEGMRWWAHARRAASASDGRLFGFLLLLSAVAGGGLAVILSLTGGLSVGTYEYDRIARNIAGGNGFVLTAGAETILWRPPLYIYLLAGAYRCFGASAPTVMIALQVLINAATAWMAFRIGERLAGRPVGFVAAALLSVYPVFVINATRLMPETLFSFALAVSAWLIIRLRETFTVGRVAALGLLVGLSALTKASIQFLPLFLAGWWIAFERRRVRPARSLAGFALATVLALAVIAPWTIRNHRVSGDFILIDTSGGYTFWIGNRLATDGNDDDPLTPAQRDEIKRDVARVLGVEYGPGLTLANSAWSSARSSSLLYAEGMRNVLARPLATAGLSVRKLFRFWFCYIGESRALHVVVAVMQAVLVLPAAFGVWLAWRRRSALLGLLPILAYFPLLHMASTSSARYSVPVLPYILILAVFAVVGSGGFASASDGLGGRGTGSVPRIRGAGR